MTQTLSSTEPQELCKAQVLMLPGGRLSVLSAGESQLPLHGCQEAQPASGTDSAAEPQTSSLVGSGHFWDNLLTYPSPDMPEVGFQLEKPESSLAHHQRSYDTPCSSPLVNSCLLFTLLRAPFQCCSTENTFAGFTQTFGRFTPCPAYPTSQPCLSLPFLLL